MSTAKRLNLTKTEDQLQTYNGRGKVFGSTEQGYHGFEMKKIAARRWELD